VIGAIAGMQAVVVAVVLLTACGMKLSRVAVTRSALPAPGAAALFPAWLRRPATLAVSVIEASLGLALLLTAWRPLAGMPADVVRLASALFFLLALCALVELRERRPELGCGCFGDLSSKPPGTRSIARAGLLAGASLAAIHAPAVRLPAPGRTALADLGVLIAEFMLLAAVSPEVGEALARLGYSEPCEVRALSLSRVLSSLQRSPAWHSHLSMIISDSPADVWRELCWCYFAYRARDEDGDCEVVFAVEVKPHRPAIRAAVVRGELAPWYAGPESTQAPAENAQSPAESTPGPPPVQSATF
jgi:hypothetical protein